MKRGVVADLEPVEWPLVPHTLEYDLFAGSVGVACENAQTEPMRQLTRAGRVAEIKGVGMHFLNGSAKDRAGGDFVLVAIWREGIASWACPPNPLALEAGYPRAPGAATNMDIPMLHDRFDVGLMVPTSRRRAANDWLTAPAHQPLRLRGLDCSVGKDGELRLGDTIHRIQPVMHFAEGPLP